MKPTPLAVLALAAASAHADVPLDGKTGRLPALGFNSWNAFRCDINEAKFLTAAHSLLSHGLADAGYKYINIDDCWSLKTRDASTNQLVPDPAKFPDGIRGTAEKIHALGLKLGIYGDAGAETCAGYPGSLGRETLDAATWAEWGVDYLKYDNCAVPARWDDEYTYMPELWFGTWENQTRPAPPGYEWARSRSAERYRRMRRALEKTGRTVLFSLCNWGHARVERWGNDTGQSWRMWGDIWPAWTGQYDYSWGFMPIVNHALYQLEYSGFFGHMDMDMLEVGNGELTAAETRSHFALWAALKSPLLIGTPLDTISAQDLSVLKNPRLLAFNQDPVYGAPAMPYKWGLNPDWTWNQTHPAEYYSGQSVKGIHVFMLNTLDRPTTKSAVFAEVPGLDAGKSYEVVDMWTGRKMGTYRREVRVRVDAHDTAALLFTEKGGKHPHAARLGRPAVYQRKPSRWAAPEL